MASSMKEIAIETAVIAYTIDNVNAYVYIIYAYTIDRFVIVMRLIYNHV